MISKISIIGLLIINGVNGETLNNLVDTCMPSADIDTLAAIVKTESSFHPFALSLNHPGTLADRAGLPPGKLYLKTQPTSKPEAIAWGELLIRQGYTLSVGLMQVSTESGWGVATLLDPCRNIQIGWNIFLEKYNQAAGRAGPGNLAFLQALSLYNSGSLNAGFSNGYVGNVVMNRYRH
jgi:type IV secretion system protein VirB1